MPPHTMAQTHTSKLAYDLIVILKSIYLDAADIFKQRSHMHNTMLASCTTILLDDIGTIYDMHLVQNQIFKMGFYSEKTTTVNLKPHKKLYIKTMLSNAKSPKRLAWILKACETRWLQFLHTLKSNPFHETYIIEQLAFNSQKRLSFLNQLFLNRP